MRVVLFKAQPFVVLLCSNFDLYSAKCSSVMFYWPYRISITCTRVVLTLTLPSHNTKLLLTAEMMT